IQKRLKIFLAIPNQKKSPIEEPKHSFNMGYKHFNTNLVTNDIAESSTKNLVPIPHEIKINSDDLNSHVEFNSVESTSNHDTVKFDNLDEFSGPLIHIHIVEEERIRREHAEYINRMEMLFTINPRPHPSTYANMNVESFSSLPIPIQESDSQQEEIDVVTETDDVLPPGIKNDDSDGEVDAVDDLRVDNSISNSKHESSESEDSDFDNPSVPLPPPEPPDEEFDFEIDFGDEISVDLPPVIEVFLCWIFVSVSKIFTSFDLKLVWGSRAKCDLLINNICEVFNKKIVDGRDQPIITCLEYIIKYLMKRIVVVQKELAKTVGPLTLSVTKMFDAIKKATAKWELTGIPCKHVVATINNMFENSVGVVVESRTVIIPPLYKPPICRPPKKRKKSNDKIASQSASSGKLSRKGKSVSCGKCDNVGHNRKGCGGQGGGSSQAGARKVSSQAAGATNVSGQAIGARKLSGQAAGATNVSGQAAGARKVSGQAVGSRKVFGQAADAKKASSQPSAAQSTSKQGPRHGFQGPIAGPASGSQRTTKKLVDL
nr:hypothetical protein [Tanacetum cinerariifolium]